MFEYSKSGLEVLLTGLVVVDLVELMKKSFKRLHNF
jgi:hypothetical protein